MSYFIDNYIDSIENEYLYNSDLHKKSYNIEKSYIENSYDYTKLLYKIPTITIFDILYITSLIIYWDNYNLPWFSEILNSNTIINKYIEEIFNNIFVNNVSKLNSDIAKHSPNTHLTLT